jgi:tripartite-type tricarboxylate transporter receptor subunit TctC
MQSQGYDVLVASSTGILAPARTPKAVVDTLTTAMKKFIESPEHQQKLKDFGVLPYYLDPAAYEKLWIDTEARMTPILQKLREN